MADKIKMKGHESFSIREGWLTKGLIEVSNNSKVFSEKDQTDIFGIGTNMVKSLKYWLQATSLINDNKKNEYVLSKLGQLIYKYDKYIENKFTLYLIHLNLVLNVDKAYIWNLFFNKCHFKTFSKKDLYEQICELLEADNYEYNEKVLSDEISVLLKTYLIEEKDGTPEDNFICPLTDLKLIRKISKDTYKRELSNISYLNKYVVYWAILQQTNEDNISIDELIKGNNSVCNLLNLDKITLNEYLDMLKKDKYITINRTAGLNMVYFNKKLDLENIFKLEFEGGE